MSIVATLHPAAEEVVRVAWSGQLVDSWDELELLDDYDPEIDLLDDLDEWVVD